MSPGTGRGAAAGGEEGGGDAAGGGAGASCGLPGPLAFGAGSRAAASEGTAGSPITRSAYERPAAERWRPE